MATIFLYTNTQDEPVTEQQLNTLNEFNKIYKVDNIIKKIESFKEGSLYQVTHYKEEDESVSDLLNNYSNLQFLEIRERSFLSSFKIENVKNYSNNELTYTSKELFDQNNNLICVEILDDNELPIFNETEKYLYQNNEKVLSFCYKEDGAIKYIWGDLVENTDQRQKGSISSEMISTYFPNFLSENPYYSTASFLP